MNADDGAGGRILLDLTAVGTYQVNADGTGVIEFTNTLPSGNTAQVTFDFVITASNRILRGASAADTIYAIQREPGVTASPVFETFTRRR